MGLVCFLPPLSEPKYCIKIFSLEKSNELKYLVDNGTSDYKSNKQLLETKVNYYFIIP